MFWGLGEYWIIQRHGRVLVFIMALFALTKLCLFAKKCVNSKPFLARTIFFSHQNFLKCHQTSTMPSWSFGGLHFFFRWQNPLFLDSYPSLGHLILPAWPIRISSINVSGYTKKFACYGCEQGCKNKMLVVTKFSLLFFASAKLYFLS